ncbi:hypothetical protein [Pediococcus inopinatus]|uniref:hypothetical protein n=1 Tax=Pediococcus inopinatus TaxID=114090 RepID=UPI00070D893C|nr:hypothetical protein [Pediococcus inopinatus]AVK99474.1 hypothetical protein PI20285_01725 [Pediococcus inopinatus]KRN62151.1 hypothetical protein IV83_GL000384 [Pediococcus inopinatus]WPC20523.1 hypothetical protein N6G95_04875 [Pediococcus inopinatus]
MIGIPKVATALSIINGVFQQKSLSFTQKKERQSADFGATVQLLPYIGFPFVINSVQKIHTAALTLSGDGSK